MFQGATGVNLDAKGRLAVPTKHRALLQSGSNSKLVLTAHPHRCLLLYPEQAWEPISAKLMTFTSLDPQVSVWKRLLVGYAEDLELDAAGRFLISPGLRKFAGLEKQLMFVGQGSHFELWSESGWEKLLEGIESAVETSPPGMEDFAL
jgi:MraZ protein